MFGVKCYKICLIPKRPFQFSQCVALEPLTYTFFLFVTTMALSVSFHHRHGIGFADGPNIMAYRLVHCALMLVFLDKLLRLYTSHQNITTLVPVTATHCWPIGFPGINTSQTASWKLKTTHFTLILHGWIDMPPWIEGLVLWFWWDKVRRVTTW